LRPFGHTANVSDTDFSFCWKLAAPTFLAFCLSLFSFAALILPPVLHVHLFSPSFKCTSIVSPLTLCSFPYLENEFFCSPPPLPLPPGPPDIAEYSATCLQHSLRVLLPLLDIKTVPLGCLLSRLSMTYHRTLFSPVPGSLRRSSVFPSLPFESTVATPSGHFRVQRAPKRFFS